MRNPWPVYLTMILATTGIVGFAEENPDKSIFIPFFVLFVLIIIYFMFLLKYPNWISSKVNPIVEKYQKDGDEVVLYNGLVQWRTRAFPKYTRNIITINIMDALLEKNNLDLLSIELSKFKSKAKSKEELTAYYLYSSQYYMKKKEKAKSNEDEKLYNYYSSIEENTKKKKKNYTVYECRESLYLWLSFSLVNLVAGFIAYSNLSANLDFIGIILVLIGLISIPFIILWLIFYFKRKANIEELLALN